MTQLTLFIDDGGVINDNSARGPQWQRLVAAFFAPRLGGTPEAWAAANYELISSILSAEAWDARLRAAPDYATFDHHYQWDWLRGMCERVGVAVPPEAEAVALAREATAWLIPQVRAAFPGAVEAIWALHGAGYTLYTASGEPASDLAGYLGGLGVRDCFTRLYGPDLIETFKVGPEFHARLLADAGVAPQDALIVDDNPTVIGWAASVGAHTAIVGEKHQADCPATLRLGSLADLPARLAAWERSA
jgi:phosphoglycolate phosphatase-like HAD superfamily hydrolase